MTGLTIAAVICAWWSGFGAAYSVGQPYGEDREIGRWVFRIAGFAAVILTALAVSEAKR